MPGLTATWLDFETYWSDEYTLKKMSPLEYALDPRFEALGCAFVDIKDNAVWVDGPDLPGYFASVDWSTIYAVSHNALFDMAVLQYRYGVKPKMYGDSMAMARNWISHHTGRVSLEACSNYFGLPPKMQTVNKTKGVSFAMLQQMPDLHREVRIYGVDDARKCKTIFTNIMRDGFPAGELEVIDWVVRMAAQPQLELDAVALAQHLAEVKQAKAKLLEDAQLIEPGAIDQHAAAKANLLSDERFAGLLMMEGVPAPMKRSKSNPEKEIFAFAKTDKEFTALLDHDNPKVQTLVAARLGHKSTLEESRSERLLNISRFTIQCPVPLKYSGAHTHRFSGEWSINLQNLPTRGSSNQLRKSLRAPKGKVVVSIDASQIEARLNATLSGQSDLIEDFRNGIDVYAKFAEFIYGYEINKWANPTERFVGKTGILSLGYNASPLVFQAMCRNLGNVELTLQEATSVVFLYRQRYQQIVQNWNYADKVVLPMIAGDTSTMDELMRATGMLPITTEEDTRWRAWGPVGIVRNALVLPSGNRLRYRDLHQELFGGRMQWTYMRGALHHHVYGAKLVENVIQALAFVHIVEVAIRVWKLTQGLLWPAHQVHDELLYVVDANLAAQVGQLVEQEMSKPPAWMPYAPLAAEWHEGDSYGELKAIKL